MGMLSSHGDGVDGLPPALPCPAHTLGDPWEKQGLGSQGHGARPI